jgi:ankyrin repeat protein
MASGCNDNNTFELVQYLVQECGADVDVTTSQGETPLYRASYSNCYLVVQYLLEKGANVHATNHTGHTVLHAALGRPNPLSIELRQKTLLLLLKYY